MNEVCKEKKKIIYKSNNHFLYKQDIFQDIIFTK